MNVDYGQLILIIILIARLLYIIFFVSNDSESELPICMSECEEEALPAYELIQENELIQEIDEDIKPPEYQVITIEELPRDL